jgi:HPt (histidine-containing phosphotransfer) domain-containing protein
MAALTIAVETEQTEETARLAHTLRGAALNLGANHLADAARELERAGRRGDMTTAASLLPGVRSEYERMKAFLAKCENPADLPTQRTAD